MHCWPTSDRPRPRAPKNVKMIGRPKTCRKRETHEKPNKSNKMPKIGTKIICTRCKSYGPNKSTCEKRNGQGQSTTPSNRHELGPCHLVENSAAPMPNTPVIYMKTDIHA